MNPLVPLGEEVELPATLPNAVPVALRKLSPCPCGESQSVMVSSVKNVAPSCDGPYRISS